MPVKQRLDALTSLRFVAAAMIAIYHSAGLFGLSPDNTHNYFLLGQAVSFFFVLSGFILAYVYPKMETWFEVKLFFRARIARIWPALMASLVLAYWLLSLRWDSKIAIANIFMVHAWIPFPNYFFAYNSPSWSISTEFFFYLAFPFLIYRWDKTWKVKLLVSGIVVVSLILGSRAMKLPGYVSSNDGITSTALIYIHPASRIFEFILGIFVAFYWRKKARNIEWTELRATLYEISAILLAGVSMHFISPFLAQWVGNTRVGSYASEYLYSSGSTFSFGLLIYVIGIGRGQISAWLSHRIFVLLGEISFSVYLLHQILLNYYRINIASFPQVSEFLSLTIFWVILLLASYLMWALIEMPGRRLLLGKGQKKIHGTKIMQESWRTHFNLNHNTISATIILTCLLASIYYSMESVIHINASEADAMTPKELQALVGTRFGNKFLLRGINIVHQIKGLYVEIAWENLNEQKFTFTNGIHLTDVNGNILEQADYKQPKRRLIKKPGVIWKDMVFIPEDKMKGRVNKLAISLYGSKQLLPVDRGIRDWGNRRLLVNIERYLAYN
jgi:peptidoglycan/LPS O-acetylase OafA/YrhL